MPRYELMYLLAGTITDDKLAETAANIRQIVTDFGATDIQEDQLGKKKLAFQIGKTKNGFYAVLTFNMPPNRLASLDAKLRTLKSTVIRYLLINIDDHQKRLAKDKLVQSKLPPRKQPAVTVEDKAAPSVKTDDTATATIQDETDSVAVQKTTPVNVDNLDEQIEAALSGEDVI